MVDWNLFERIFGDPGLETKNGLLERLSNRMEKSRQVVFLGTILLLDTLSSFMAAGCVELSWEQQLARKIIAVVLFYCAAYSVRMKEY